jgi:hypothetical protein
MRNDSGQQRIAGDGFSSGRFAGIHIGLSGITGGVDDKIGTPIAKKGEQRLETRIIHSSPGQRNEVQTTAREFALKRFTDVTGATEEENSWHLNKEETSVME